MDYDIKITLNDNLFEIKSESESPNSKIKKPSKMEKSKP